MQYFTKTEIITSLYRKTTKTYPLFTITLEPIKKGLVLLVRWNDGLVKKVYTKYINELAIINKLIYNLIINK